MLRKIIIMLSYSRIVLFHPDKLTGTFNTNPLRDVEIWQKEGKYISHMPYLLSTAMRDITK